MTQNEEHIRNLSKIGDGRKTYSEVGAYKQMKKNCPEICEKQNCAIPNEQKQLTGKFLNSLKLTSGLEGKPDNAATSSADIREVPL